MSPKVKVGIGIPLSWQYCPSDFFRSFIMLQKPPESEVVVAVSGPIDAMRNAIVKRCIALKCTHVFMIDADMVFPPETLFRLLDHDKDIVGGLCFRKGPPFSPTLHVGLPFQCEIMQDFPDSGLVEVTATGAACLLIKKEVFLKMKYPWFEFKTIENGKTLGEDVGFCYRALDLGYKTYVDCGLEIEHLTQIRVGKGWYKHYQLMTEVGCIVDNQENVYRDVGFELDDHCEQFKIDNGSEFND